MGNYRFELGLLIGLVIGVAYGSGYIEAFFTEDKIEEQESYIDEEMWDETIKLFEDLQIRKDDKQD